MRRLMKIFALLLIALTLCLSMTGCNLKEDIAYLLAKPVEFASGKFHPFSEELSLTVKAEELPLLDGFEQLKKIDFSGSTCYKELAQWALSHPDVEVLCAVPLANGSTVQLMTEQVDISGLSHEQAEAMTESLKLLPKLSRVELGSSTGGDGDLTVQDLSAFKTALPKVTFNSDDYAFTALGQTLYLHDTALDLSAISAEDVDEALALVSIMPMLTSIDFGSDKDGLTLEDVYKFQSIFSDIDMSYKFSLYGKTYTINDEQMDFSFQPITDNGEALCTVLPYLPRCSYVDMDSCGISNERMAEMQAQFPAVKLVWRVFIGHAYTLRTDAIRLLASKPTEGGNLSAADLDPVKYCTDLKYIDIGHNENVASLEFMSTLTKLEVAIISENPHSDLSPLANCHNLEYLEVFETNITSLEPLRGLKNLKHINITSTNITDISPLYDIDFERLWIGGYTPVPDEQVAEIKALHPDSLVDDIVDSSVGGAWRYGKTNCWPWQYHERYALLREQMGYDNLEYNFIWKDELYMAHFG